MYSYLSKTFLSGPHAGVNDLQEQLSCTRVEDENSSIDGFGRQVTLECFVDSHTIYIRVVYEPTQKNMVIRQFVVENVDFEMVSK